MLWAGGRGGGGGGHATRSRVIQGRIMDSEGDAHVALNPNPSIALMQTSTPESLESPLVP